MQAKKYKLLSKRKHAASSIDGHGNSLKAEEELLKLTKAKAI
jgi:hypothetical protein